MTDLIAELAEELRRINAYCELPDGDGVSMSVALWAERWADRLHESHATLTRIITDDAAIRAAHTELVIRLGEVTTELEAARKDAERYAYLKNRTYVVDHDGGWSSSFCIYPIARHDDSTYGGAKPFRFGSLDAAIDAVMKGSGK